MSYEISLRWMPLDLTYDKSTLVQLMAWCRQAPSHYLSQCWPRSMLPNGVTRPQWVKMVSGLHSLYNWNPCIYKDSLYNETGPEGCFNAIMVSYRYIYSHCPYKTIWWPFSLQNEISYTTTSLYWNRPLGSLCRMVHYIMHYGFVIVKAAIFSKGLLRSQPLCAWR